jgi:hypothetical protein
VGLGEPAGRGGFDLAAVIVTWDVAVFVIAARRRRRVAFATVPRASLARFLRALQAGELDDVIASYAGRRAAGRRLGHHGQTEVPGLLDELADRGALLAPERDPG